MEPGYTAMTTEFGIELQEGTSGGTSKMPSLTDTAMDEQPLAS